MDHNYITVRTLECSARAQHYVFAVVKITTDKGTTFHFLTLGYFYHQIGKTVKNLYFVGFIPLCFSWIMSIILRLCNVVWVLISEPERLRDSDPLILLPYLWIQDLSVFSYSTTSAPYTSTCSSISSEAANVPLCGSGFGESPQWLAGCFYFFGIGLQSCAQNEISISNTSV